MSVTKVADKKLKELGIYIKKMRGISGLGTNQLALKIGVSPSYITKLEKGHIATVHPYLLQKVAKGLRISYKELYRIVDYLEAPTEKEIKNEFNLENAMETLQIPLYGSISAGLGRTEGQILDFINVPTIKNPQDCFAIRVEGDSMEPTIPDGSIIIVRKNKEIPDGSIGAFITDEGAVVKRVYRTKTETVLSSDNSIYPPKVINKESFEFYECGRVINVLMEL